MSDSTGKYDDIINIPRPVSKTRKHMSNHDRAAQFAPFAALTGYDEAVSETARLTDSATELDEYEKEEINRRLCYLRDNMDTTVKITFFVPDDKKEGGEYKTTEAAVVKIRDYEKELILNTGEVIAIDKIAAIESDVFDKLEFLKEEAAQECAYEEDYDEF